MPCSCGCGNGCGSVEKTVQKSKGPDADFFSPYITAYSTGSGSRHAARVRRNPEMETSGAKANAWTKNALVQVADGVPGDRADLASETKAKYKWPQKTRLEPGVVVATKAWREESGFTQGNARLYPEQEAVEPQRSTKQASDDWLQSYVGDAGPRVTWKRWQQKERLGPVPSGFVTSLARQGFPLSHQRLEGESTTHAMFRRPRFDQFEPSGVKVNQLEPSGFAQGNVYIRPSDNDLPPGITEYKDRYQQSLERNLPADGLVLERGGNKSGFTHPLLNNTIPLLRATTAPERSEMHDKYRKPFGPAFENIPHPVGAMEISGYSRDWADPYLPRGVETSTLPPRKEVLENLHPTVARVLLSRCSDNLYVTPDEMSETTNTMKFHGFNGKPAGAAFMRTRATAVPAAI